MKFVKIQWREKNPVYGSYFFSSKNFEEYFHYVFKGNVFHNVVSLVFSWKLTQFTTHILQFHSYFISSKISRNIFIMFSKAMFFIIQFHWYFMETNNTYTLVSQLFHCIKNFKKDFHEVFMDILYYNEFNMMLFHITFIGYSIISYECQMISIERLVSSESGQQA